MVDCKVTPVLVHSPRHYDVWRVVSRRLPIAAAPVRAMSGHGGICDGKVALGRFSPNTSVSPANSHSTDCSTIICHLGLV
jgi:hypothetical protein